MKYSVVKTYGHQEGWACTFRQHKATSHCRFIHGYALAFELTFECSDLDSRGWCIDFGDLKPIKNWLQDMFDHKTLVAEDDPELSRLTEMAARGLIDMMVVPATGCEKFAELVYNRVIAYLAETSYYPRVDLVSVKVAEHPGNGAICSR
jgi:6-pyruvoyltetrahydropterin/6-carboxytetrahydropterin synthase